MYQKKSQNCPIALFLVNKIGRYSGKTRKIRMNNFGGSVIHDQKELRLYLEIMEALAMDNQKVVQDKRRKAQSSIKLPSPLPPNLSTLKSSQSLPHIPLQPQPHQQNSLDSEDSSPPTIDTLGLSSEEGLQKLENVTKIIVNFCDRERRTKDVHKVLYLVMKYLQFRVKTKDGFRVGRKGKEGMEEEEEQEERNKVEESDDIIQLLSDACSLFWDDLQTPPITDPNPNPKQKPKKDPVPLSHPLPPHPQKQKKLPKVPSLQTHLTQSSRELSRSNPYHYLISLLEKEELEKLATSLEYEISGLNVDMDGREGRDRGRGREDGEMVKEYLVDKLESVLQLIFRRVYTKKCIEQCSNPESTKPLLITSFIKKSQRKSTPSTSFPWLHESQQKLSGQGYEKYHKLLIALKYITCILLGNQKVIAAYADANVYLYLGLYMLYVDRGEDGDQGDGQAGDERREKDDGEGGDEMGLGRKMKKLEGDVKKTKKKRSKQRSVIDLEKFTQIAEQFLQKSFKVSLRGPKAQSQLRLPHKLILQLLSLPLPESHPYKHHPQSSRRLLSYHYFFQNLLSYFIGYEFYAYLIITIIFNLGLVNKQLYSLDQEYQSNVMGELLMCTVAEVKGGMGGEREGEGEGAEDQMGGLVGVGRDGRDVEEYSVWNDGGSGVLGEGMEGDRNSLAYSRDENVNSLGNNNRQSNWVQPPPPEPNPPTIPQTPLPTLKLLLSTISFYKHKILPQNLQKSYLLASLLQNLPNKNLPKHVINSELAYGRLPLHQVIQNLISGVMVYQRVGGYQGVDWVKGVARYAVRFGVEEYVLQYIKNLIIFNMDYGEPGKTHPFDKYILELMALQLKICLISSQSTSPTQTSPQTFTTLLQSLPHHQTYTLNLFISNYLLSWTLTSPFTYDLLNKVRELTGVESELRKLSAIVAEEFYGFFGVFFKLEVITRRGRSENWRQGRQGREGKQEDGKKDQVVANIEKKQSNIKKLKQMIKRVQLLNEILSSANLQGCGQVLRVTWQLLQQYHCLKTHITKQLTFPEQQQHLLEKLSNKTITIVESLRNYINAMQSQNYVSQELVKFKEMIF